MEGSQDLPGSLPGTRCCLPFFYGWVGAPRARVVWGEELRACEIFYPELALKFAVVRVDFAFPVNFVRGTLSGLISFISGEYYRRAKTKKRAVQTQKK